MGAFMALIHPKHGRYTRQINTTDLIQKPQAVDLALAHLVLLRLWFQII
jgi:hypothetical protein